MGQVRPQRCTFIVQETLVTRKEYRVLARSEQDAVRMVGVRKRLKIEPTRVDAEFPLSVRARPEGVDADGEA